MNFSISERRERDGIRETENSGVSNERVFGMIETLLRHGYSTFEIASLTQAGQKYSLGMQEMLADLAVNNEDGTFSIPGCPGYQEEVTFHTGG